MSTDAELAPIPAEEWEQQGPVGGAYDGQSPPWALFVAPVGVGTVREVPALMGSSGSVRSGGVGYVAPLVSADPHRRAIIIGGITGTPLVATHRAIAESGLGVPVPATAAAIRIPYAGELYVYFPLATDAVGFLCEIDPD